MSNQNKFISQMSNEDLISRLICTSQNNDEYDCFLDYKNEILKRMSDEK